MHVVCLNYYKKTTFNKFSLEMFRMRYAFVEHWCFHWTCVFTLVLTHLKERMKIQIFLSQLNRIRTLLCLLLTDKAGSVSGDSGHCSHHTDAYDELFKTPSLADLDPLDNNEEETANKVEVCRFLIWLSWTWRFIPVPTVQSSHICLCVFVCVVS